MINPSIKSELPKRLYSLLLAIAIFAGVSGSVAEAQSSKPAYIDLHDFGGSVINGHGTHEPDGLYPGSAVSFDKDGNLFGVAPQGGPNTFNRVSCGMVWMLTKDGRYVDLHDFGGTLSSGGKRWADGRRPLGAVRFDSEGNLFGTTVSGGAFQGGMVWELTRGGEYRDLHDFGNPAIQDGSEPYAPVSFDSDGDLVGTAGSGGKFGGGVVWILFKQGAYRILHAFGGNVTLSSGQTGPDGVNPWSPVSFDLRGSIYGTTQYGGPNNKVVMAGAGIVWRISPEGGYQDVHDFGGTVTNFNGHRGPDGVGPFFGGVAIDDSGNLFGATSQGGPNDIEQGVGQDGMVWEITRDGEYRDLHDFGGVTIVASGANGRDGSFPAAGVTIDPSGNIAGTTENGGVFGQQSSGFGGGNFWEISPVGVYHDLHDFGGNFTNGQGQSVPDAGFCTASVCFDPLGNAYGTSSYGGAYGDSSFGEGMLWKLGIGLLHLILEPSTVVGGASTTGKVILSFESPASGTVVDFSTRSNQIRVPSQVTIPAGARSASFSISTLPVATDSAAMIEANLGVVNCSAELALVAPAVSSLSTGVSTVIGGNATTASVVLTGKAPAGGLRVSLSSSSADVGAPSSIVIGAGKSSATFTINTVPVAANLSATITARIGSSSRSAGLNVLAPSLAWLELKPSSVLGGAPSEGVVSLSGNAPAGGFKVQLSFPKALVSMPPSVSVGAGAHAAIFKIETVGVSQNVVANISAQLGTSIKKAGLLLNAPVIKSFSLSPSKLQGGGKSQGTVTLSSAAPATGLKVSVSAASSAVTTPSSVTVPAHSTSVKFSISTVSVASSVVVGIRAKTSTGGVTANLSIEAPTLVSVSVHPGSVKGSSSTAIAGTVALSGGAPVGGLTVTLKSSDPAAASLPPSVKIAAGHVSAAFVVKHFKVTRSVVVTITGSLKSGSRSTKITINP